MDAQYWLNQTLAQYLAYYDDDNEFIMSQNMKRKLTLTIVVTVKLSLTPPHSAADIMGMIPGPTPVAGSHGHDI